MKAQAAINLPITITQVCTGKVNNNSTVPVFRSSAQSRIEIAGIKKKIKPWMKTEERV